MGKVHVRDIKSAFWASFGIIIAGFLIGWLLTFFLNMVTLGFFWLIGFGLITRTIAYAIVIELVDRTNKNFKTDGFMPSLWLSIILAVSWGVIDILF